MKPSAAPNNKDPYEGLDGNPIVSDVVENNIRSMLRLSAQRLRERTLQDRMADGITFISGRMPFVYFPAIWFALGGARDG